MLQQHNNKFHAASFIRAALLAASLSACKEQAPPAAQRAEAAAMQQKGDFASATVVLKNVTELAPDDGEARVLLAKVYLDRGDGISADKEIRMAIKLGSASALTMPILARALLLEGQFQKLLDDTVKQAVHKDPVLLALRGDAWLALDKHDEARELYQRLLSTQNEFIPALIGMGRMAYLEGDVATARSYAARALAAGPDDTDALLFQGDLLRAQNQPEQALASYDRVLVLHPTHRSAHIEKAYLETSLGKFDAAQADLVAAKALTPSSVLIAYTQALLDYSKGDDGAALESVQKVLRVAPEHMPTVLLAGAISQRAGSLYQAEHHLRHYLDKNPDSLLARKMLASTLLRTRHTPDALSVLGPAMTSEQKDVQLLALAGETFMQARDFGKAEEYFGRASLLAPKAANLRTSLALSKLGKGKQAAAIDDLQAATRLDINSLQAGIALVRTELQLRHVDQAYAAVETLERAQPKSAAAVDLKGIVYIAKGDPASARASFTRALTLDAAYFAAAENLAQLDLRENKRADARAHLVEFLGKNKNSVEAMSALASLAASEKNDAEAARWLAQAVAVDPVAIGPAVNLIAHELRTGEHDKALTLARKLRIAHPDNPDLLDLLGRAQLASGETNNALSTYKTLAVTLPRSAEAQMQVAALELMAKNTIAAEDYLKTALAIQPDFPAAQLALAELYTRKGHFALALMVAGQLQARHPKASAGYQLEADILMIQHKPAEALPLYEQALALTRSSELLVKTASALRAVGKGDEAARRIVGWLQGHPDDLRVQLFKAEILLADKHYKLATEQLEATRLRSPKNVTVLNNLAMAYLQSQDARAEQVAEQAYALAADQPAVMDTLGWILVEKGDTERGLAILQRASAQAPDSREIRFHVAMGLLKSGDKLAARKQLEALVAGNAQFAQAEEVRAALRQLQ